jgi:Gpi18-like mannosyltransferase
MEKQGLSHVLVILAGLLRTAGIACMIALIFMGARLRYIFLIALLTVGGVFTTDKGARMLLHTQ